jgi:ubiquinone/menaquinone biosynthesis C-methylase UbiE
MNNSNRSETWKKIWNKKGEEKNKEVHHLNGYNYLSESQYSNICKILTKSLNINKDSNVIECGCGAGAFLLNLKKLYNISNITGVDYSKEILNHARSNIDGNFYNGSIDNMPFLKSNYYDFVINFSVLHYLNSEEMAKNAILEFIRILKPGGKIFIGDVNDLDKIDIYYSERKKSHESKLHMKSLVSKDKLTTNHLLLSKDFFRKIVNELDNVKILNIIDHDELEFSKYYPCSPYRYSVYLQKN